MSTPARYRFRLGEWVRITGTVEKVNAPGQEIPGCRYPRRSDKTVTYREASLPVTQVKREPVTEGVIVGQRTVWNHAVTYLEDGVTASSPQASTSQKVWIVAWHMRRQPVMCFDHQVTRAS